MNANTRALIAIIVINFVTIAGFGFMFPVFAIYGKAIDANATEIALSIASFSLGQLIASPLWGKISDRYGRRNVLVISLLVGAVLTALNVFAVTPWLLIFARFICGLASGSFSVAFAVAADISNAENRTRVMGMVGAGFSLGFILGPAIGGFAAGNDPGVDAFARVCIAGAAMMGFGGILTLFILPETRKRHEPSADATPVAVRSNLTLLRDPALAFPIILSLITSLALSKMESTFAIFADDVLHLPPSRIGLIFAVMGTIGAIVQFAGAGLLAKKLGERGMLMLALCFLTVGMFVVGSSTALPAGVRLPVSLVHRRTN